MRTLKEIDNELKEIDSKLFVKMLGTGSLTICKKSPLTTDDMWLIYDFNDHKFLSNPEICLSDGKAKQLRKFIDDLPEAKVYGNYQPREIDYMLNKNHYKNQFKHYTDHLADVLNQKNLAYGDSFTKSLDEDGLLVLKIRLGDKFNRISSLIKRGELKENDESLEDTLLDMAGYSILGLKYLKEHENENS